MHLNTFQKIYLEQKVTFLTLYNLGNYNIIKQYLI